MTAARFTRTAISRRMADTPELGIIAAVGVAFAFFAYKNPLFASGSELQRSEFSKERIIAAAAIDPAAA